MNKINENKNKSQAFNDKIAMFNTKKSKEQINQLPLKIEPKPFINKSFAEPKKGKETFVNNENINKKIVEKPKENKSVLNIINQINNKNSLSDNKKEQKIKQPIENKNFKASLNIFSNISKENKDNREKVETNNNIENAIIKEEKKESERIFEKNKKGNNEKELNKIPENKIEKNSKKGDDTNQKEQDIIQKEEKNNFKNILNLFDKEKEKETNKTKDNNIIKSTLENKEESNIKINTRMRSATIQERLKLMNIDQKEQKNNINQFKNNKQIMTIIEEEKPEEKEGNENINQNNKINSIHQRQTVFSKKTNINKENKNPQIQEKIIIGEGIQKKIQCLQNHNNIKENYIVKKNKINTINFEFSMIEKLKAIYQPKIKESKSEAYPNNSFGSNNKSDNKLNSINSTKKQNELTNKEETKNKIGIINKEKIISNTNNINNNINNNSPKKLDLGKIFKDMNIEKVSSMVKETKRQEIIQFALQQKEEKQRMTKATEINSDSLDFSEEEKEKEEKEENQEKEDNIHIEKNQIEESENYQLERLSNIEDYNEEKEKESQGLEKKEKIKKEFVDHLKNRLSNFSQLKNDKSQGTEQKLQSEINDIIGERNTISNKDSVKPLDNNNEPIPRKMRKTMPFFKKKSNSPPLIDDDTFLQSKTISKNEKPKINTFCESFFLTSFSKDNCKIMENSYDNQAECNHFFCNILPAMQPEIIYKYPKEDIKGLEINNLAASICFPNGVKLCYDEKEENIKAVKNYRSSFTNQVGDRFFAVTYHFFLRKNNREFESEQNLTPIQYEIGKYQDELRTLLNDEEDEDIFSKLNILGDFSKKEYINVPYCLCLISKYPFIEQMEKCLESIVMSINDEKVDIKDLNKYISYIVSSIPAPPNHCKILFPLAYHYKLVEIQYPYFKDINQFGDNPLILLKYLSESNILILFKLLVFEQKIIIVGKDNDLISQIILNFVTLLYPFEWVHTFIPIMSEKMLKFLQAFIPFFNGMNITLFKKAKPILAQASKGVFIFNIDDKTIEINSNYICNSKKTKSSSYIKKNIPNFPKNIDQLILKELKSIKMNLSKIYEEQEKLIINLRIKNLFLQVFTELLYDYKKYSYIIDDYPVFNSFLLIKEKEKKGNNFYQEFSSTQLFQMFIQNSLFRPEDKKSYFEERLIDFKGLKKSGASISFNMEKLFPKFKEDYFKSMEIKKKYVIKPFFIKEFIHFEEKKTSQNKKIKLSDIVQFLAQHYEKPVYTELNIHGVLKENKRLIERDIELTNDNDPEEYQVYYLPNQKEVIKEKNDSEINIEKEEIKIKRVKSIKIGIISKEEDNKKNIIKIAHSFSSKEYELSEDEIDEIKDNIRETMTRVYRSDVSRINEDKKMMIDSLKTQFGRDYFIKILYNGYKQDYLVKNMVNESYYFFSDVIFNTLLDILKLEENDENIICSVKLLKSCQYIGTTKNKKEFLLSHSVSNVLSDELYNKLEGYSLFNKKRFWELWIEDDLTEKELIIKNLINDGTEYIDEEKEEIKSYMTHIYSIIDKLTSIMMKMKINNNSIYINIYELSKKYILDEKQITQLREEAFGQLQIYKVYSNK